MITLIGKPLIVLGTAVLFVIALYLLHVVLPGREKKQISLTIDDLEVGKYQKQNYIHQEPNNCIHGIMEEITEKRIGSFFITSSDNLTDCLLGNLSLMFACIFIFVMGTSLITKDSYTITDYLVGAAVVFVCFLLHARRQLSNWRKLKTAIKSKQYRVKITELSEPVQDCVELNVVDTDCKSEYIIISVSTKPEKLKYVDVYLYCHVCKQADRSINENAREENDHD